jgi:PilZ domain
MPASSLAKAASPTNPSSDDRREWIRIDDHLLLEYRLLSDSADAPLPGQPPVTHDMIADAVGKPTADLLARSGEMLANSPLLPWVMKVDWLLEVMLKAMATVHPQSMTIARLTKVSISGGGISFVSSRQFSAGDQLVLKVILPPFTPIQTVAKVIRSAPNTDGQGYSLATEFVELKADDQEHLIRHIIQAQAERLRARRTGS